MELLARVLEVTWRRLSKLSAVTPVSAGGYSLVIVCDLHRATLLQPSVSCFELSIARRIHVVAGTDAKAVGWWVDPFHHGGMGSPFGVC